MRAVVECCGWENRLSARMESVRIEMEARDSAEEKGWRYTGVLREVDTVFQAGF